MRVLIFIDYFLPGFRGGGPVQSVANLMEHLGGEIQFDVITRNYDLGQKNVYANINSGVWLQSGQARIVYLSNRISNFWYFRRILKQGDYDCVYINSFFSPDFSMLPLLSIKSVTDLKAKVILAPRGEFAKAALAIKPVRKLLYRVFSQLLGLHRGSHWHASTELEARDIMAGFPIKKGRIHTASDLPRKVEASRLAKTHRDQGRPLQVCFLSRVSPMKNLLFAIEALSKVTEPVDFFIYGPVEDINYWRNCQSAISLLPSHVRAHYRGPIASDAVVATLRQHDIFFLPSRGENYGHVIAEALQAGLPILVSDQTPWRNLVERGIGIEIALSDPRAFARHIDELARAGDDRWLKFETDIDAQVAVMGDQTVAIQNNRALFNENQPIESG